MMDTTTSQLLSLLESGPKTVTEMSSTSGVDAAEIHKRFEPLARGALVIRTDTKDNTTYSADAAKLDEAFKSHNFDETINVVTQMDSYLN